MSVNVWVVFGSSGEYEDYAEWAVCAYQDKDRALDHARLAKEDSVAIAKEKGGRYAAPKRKNLYDPDMYMDGDCTDYGIRAIPLLDGIPGIDG